MTGTFINVAAIISGSLLGVCLKQSLPERISNTIMQAIALVVLYTGINMAGNTHNIIVPLLSLIAGAITGEVLGIENWLEKISMWVQSRLPVRDSGNFGRAFVGSTLLFIVGPMAIVGSINDGLTGKFDLLLTKSVMDGISSIALGASLGIGVLFSAVPVFLYQGTITLTAGIAAGIFSETLIAEIMATGGIIIIGLATNMLEVTRIRIGNLLPALVVVIFISRIVSTLGIS